MIKVGDMVEVVEVSPSDSTLMSRGDIARVIDVSDCITIRLLDQGMFVKLDVNTKIKKVYYN
jgi:hypothetical protein